MNYIYFLLLLDKSGLSDIVKLSFFSFKIKDSTNSFFQIAFVFFSSLYFFTVLYNNLLSIFSNSVLSIYLGDEQKEFLFNISILSRFKMLFRDSLKKDNLFTFSLKFILFIT